MSVPFRREAGETGRLPALSDGVIAIVITLLVLDITVPTVPAGSPTSVVVERIVEQWQDFFGFVLSFLVIGQYWVLHRRTFVYIETHERGVVSLNLVFLLLVAFIPYATSVFTTYPGRLGIVFLSGVLALTGYSLAILWLYASRRDLIGTGVTSRAVQIRAAQYLASPLVFTAAIPVALVSPTAAILVWLLVIPINGALQLRLLSSLDDSQGA
ncbi:TMEM175 family protein [Haloarchaeobius sp. HRN-SO-5]|uniref:TMEM175 family protein n=1 Tax=Haloarchaeobius sp. HRN-SO-5 TaxID=3446118 RepID=UPI003EBFF02B